ncbi:MAG: hypothetical protein Q9165_008049 [Trypethelium subeluteriae]
MLVGQQSLRSKERTTNTFQGVGVDALKDWPYVDEFYNNARQPFGPKELDHEVLQGILRVYGVGQTGDIQITGSDHETTEAGGLSCKDIMEIRSTFNQYTVVRLYRKYIAKVHVLYPFLDTSWLYEKLTDFVDRYARVLGQGSQMLEGVGERTLTDSVIFLVLAIGLLYEHEGPLPGLDGTHRVSESGSPLTTSQAKRQRNLELIPGLKLYAHSLDIVAFFAFYQTQTFDSERPLLQVWAFILASLCMGRLARALESRRWLDKACEAWLDLKEK